MVTTGPSHSRVLSIPKRGPKETPGSPESYHVSGPTPPPLGPDRPHSTTRRCCRDTSLRERRGRGQTPFSELGLNPQDQIPSSILSQGPWGSDSTTPVLGLRRVLRIRLPSSRDGSRRWGSRSFLTPVTSHDRGGGGGSSGLVQVDSYPESTLGRSGTGWTVGSGYVFRFPDPPAETTVLTSIVPSLTLPTVGTEPPEPLILDPSPLPEGPVSAEYPLSWRSVRVVMWWGWTGTVPGTTTRDEQDSGVRRDSDDRCGYRPHNTSGVSGKH